MKISVQINRLLAKTGFGLAVKDAAITIVGYRQKKGEAEVELFRLPLAGKVNTTYSTVKYYANPEGGVQLDEFWVELETSDSSGFSLRYNVTLDHEPPVLAMDTAPEDFGEQTEKTGVVASPVSTASLEQVTAKVGGPSNNPPPAA